MNSDALRQFLCLAEHGNYADAAQAWGTTSAALSIDVRALENSLGVLLMSHDGRKVRLTRAGERLKSLSGAYLEMVAQLREQVRAAGMAFLRISIADGIDTVEVNTKIKAPDTLESETLLFTLARSSLAQQRTGLRRGSIDVGLSQTAASPDDTDLAVDVAWREPLVAVLSERHPLAKHRALDPAMLATHSVVVAGQGYEKQIAELPCGDDRLGAVWQTRKTLGEVLLAVLDGQWIGLVGAWQWRAVQAMRGVTSRPVVDAQTGEPLWLYTYLRRPQDMDPGLDGVMAHLHRQLAHTEAAAKERRLG